MSLAVQFLFIFPLCYVSAAIVTKSKLEIKRCPIDFLELELEKLKHCKLVMNVNI